jgi:hypothetical protein
MSDIVERLRKPVSKDDPYICTNTDIQPEIKYDLLRSQAATEIERLRKALSDCILVFGVTQDTQYWKAYEDVIARVQTVLNGDK